MGSSLKVADEARDAHQEMLRHARAGERERAVAAAERFFALVRDSGDDQEMRSLIIGATGTWLQLKVALGPDDPEVLLACEETYQRHRDEDASEATVVALAALRGEICLLLRRRRKDDAADRALRLIELFRIRQLSVNRSVAADLLLAAALSLLSAQLPARAGEVGRAVFDTLGDSGEPGEALLATVGQVWVVIATMYAGERRPGSEIPNDLTALESMSVESLREMSPILDEVEILQGRGPDAVRAIDVVVGLLRRRGQWDRALLTVLSIKVEILRELDRPEELRSAMEQFVDLCSGIERWNAPALVDQMRRELDEK